MNTYKVYFRLNDKADNVHVSANDELEARASALRAFPAARLLRAVLITEGAPVKDMRPIADVIHVDFVNKRRVA